MAIIADKFKYRRIKRNSFDSIEDELVNQTAKSSISKIGKDLNHIHCRLHQRVPIIKASGKSLETLEIKLECCCEILKSKANIALKSKPLSMGNFEEKAIEFTKDIRNGSNSDREFVNNLQYELDIYRKSEHKVEFLNSILTQIDKTIKDHEATCKKDPKDCGFSQMYRNAIFFTNEELEHQNAILISNLSKQSGEKFDQDELIGVYQKIDEILGELNKLGLGQEIIFDEIESMKSTANKLSKKDFKMLFLGKVVGTGTMELMKNEVVKNFFEVEIPKLITGN